MEPPRVRRPRDSRPKFAPRRSVPQPLRLMSSHPWGLKPPLVQRRVGRSLLLLLLQGGRGEPFEAAAAVSAAHIPPRRRRTAQIRIPSRRLAKTVRPPHPVTNPVVSPVRGAHSSFPDLDSNKRASNSDDPLQLRPCHNYWRGLGYPARLDDDDDSDKLLQPLPTPPNRGDAKRARAPREDLDDDDDSDKKLQPLTKCARTDLPWRDWSGLGDGPAGLIAERVLAYDVADYVRFRAVCCPWRQSSTEPHTHSSLDRRFHPSRWTMLQEELVAPYRHSFLNTSTAECVQVDIPELHNHELLALTPEGLLVLVRDRKHIRLLNPLTRHVAELPPLTTLLPPKYHHMLLERKRHFNNMFQAWGSGIADDDSTVVLCISNLCMIGMAKPGDDSWNLLEYNGDGVTMAPLMFSGHLYCVIHGGVMVLEMGADQPPQLKKVSGSLSRHVSPMEDSVHLVNSCGELILVHRRCARKTARNKSGRGYDTYRVDLDTGTLFPVKSLGGNAVFMGLYSSLSVPPDVFPSGSLSADTIYLRFDIREREILMAGAYHLADGSVELPCSLVPRPHTLIDCLSLSNDE